MKIKFIDALSIIPPWMCHTVFHTSNSVLSGADSQFELFDFFSGLFLDANDYSVPYHVAELFEFRTKPTEFGESNEMGQQCLNFENGAVMDVKEC